MRISYTRAVRRLCVLMKIATGVRGDATFQQRISVNPALPDALLSAGVFYWTRFPIKRKVVGLVCKLATALAEFASQSMHHELYAMSKYVVNSIFLREGPLRSDEAVVCALCYSIGRFVLGEHVLGVVQSLRVMNALTAVRSMREAFFLWRDMADEAWALYNSHPDILKVVTQFGLRLCLGTSEREHLFAPCVVAQFATVLSRLPRWPETSEFIALTDLYFLVAVHPQLAPCLAPLGVTFSSC